jgi:hypothetical protein
VKLGDVLCKPVSREERRYRSTMKEPARIPRCKSDIERDMKDDFDAKVEAVRKAHRDQIAEGTRLLHSKLVNDLEEAQAKDAK